MTKLEGFLFRTRRATETGSCTGAYTDVETYEHRQVCWNNGFHHAINTTSENRVFFRDASSVIEDGQFMDARL